MGKPEGPQDAYEEVEQIASTGAFASVVQRRTKKMEGDNCTAAKEYIGK